MPRTNIDRPTFEILMAIRATQKIDTFFGKQQDRLTARQHAFVASRNRQAAERGLRKMEAQGV